MKCNHESYWLKPYSTRLLQAGCAKCGKSVCFEIEPNDKPTQRAEYELRRKRSTLSSLPLMFLSKLNRKDEHEVGFI